MENDNVQLAHRRDFIKFLLAGMTGFIVPWSVTNMKNNKLKDCLVINGWVIPKNLLTGK